MEWKMDSDHIQSIIRLLTFMHNYSADPCSETKEVNKSPSDVTSLKNTDSISSALSKGNVKDDFEDTFLIGLRTSVCSPTSSDTSSDKLVFKIPFGKVKHPKTGMSAKNSQKENQANNNSGNSDFAIPKSETSSNQINLSPINGNPKKLDLLKKPVPKRFSTTLDIRVKRKPKYDISLLSIESEIINVWDSDDLVKADDPLKFRCDVCGKGFKKKKHLLHHFSQSLQQLEHNVHAVKNPVSHNLVSTSSGTDVPKHKRQFLCIFCGAAFAWSTDLRRHQRVHEGAKVMPRLQWNFMSPQEKILLKTMQNRTLVSGKPFQHRCITCGQIFEKKNDLQMHQITHWDKYYVSK